MHNQDELIDLKQRYFDAMCYAPATVNVITTDGAAGRAGVTVSAMSSVSADGDFPVLLVCINERGIAAKRILGNGVFCVNILRETQSYISDVFAGRYSEKYADKFDATEWAAAKTGSPAIDNALATLDCRIMQTQKVGTHYVVFGEVHDIHTAGDGSALIYAKRGYNRVQPIDIRPKRPEDEDPSGPPRTLGCFHSFAPYLIPPIIQRLNQAGDTARLNLIEGDGRQLELGLLNGEIDMAFMYGSAAASGLVAQPVATLMPQVLLRTDHPLARKDTISPRDLDGEPMISAVDLRAGERIEQELLAHGVEPNVVYRSTSLEMARSMVAHGLGFAIVMASIAARGYSDQIVAKPLEVEADPGRIVLVRSEKRSDDAFDERLLSLARRVWE